MLEAFLEHCLNNALHHNHHPPGKGFLWQEKTWWAIFLGSVVDQLPPKPEKGVLLVLTGGQERVHPFRISQSDARPIYSPADQLWPYLCYGVRVPMHTKVPE